MRFLIQRVTEASVTVEEEIIGKINQGFLVFIGISEYDTIGIADKLIKKSSSASKRQIPIIYSVSASFHCFRSDHLA